MTDKELDRTLDMGFSDIEDNLILPNLSEKKPNATNNSYQAFLDDFNAWCAETFQESCSTNLLFLVVLENEESEVLKQLCLSMLYLSLNFVADTR